MEREEQARAERLEEAGVTEGLRGKPGRGGCRLWVSAARAVCLQVQTQSHRWDLIQGSDTDLT